MKTNSIKWLKGAIFLSLTLFSLPSFSQCDILGLDDEYCIDDAAVLLTGDPLGGTFSGPGMTGDTFDPGAAGVGVHTITYTIPGDTGDKYYIKSNIGNPWGSTSNQGDMDNAFGALGWTQESFEAAVPGTVFSPTTSFVFLEGSDAHANELNTFLIANLGLIETWVNAGGSLLINAAPNEGTNINFGFAGTTLIYPSYHGTVNAVDAAHPTFLGPLVPTATTMTGPYYAHGRITGAGLTSVLTNGGSVILSEKPWGAGTVMFGGMTTANWHSPAPHTRNYRTNIFVYLNDLASLIACSTTQDVEVFDLPAVTATADDIEICDGETVTLTGGGADTYVWDLGVTDGAPFTPASTGTITYTVTGTNSTTTCQNTASIDITMHPLPVITANADAIEICLGESVIFTGGGGDTYVWDLGVTNGVPFTPAAIGTLTYTVTGTNTGTSCTNTASIDVTVNDNPTVTATATPDEICLGESITFTGGGADTYAWDGGIADGVPFTPLTAGTFTYTVTGSIGATGCQDTETIDVTIHDLPVVTATVDDDEICEGESVTFTGGGADSYTWDMGVTDGVPFTPAGPGTVTYTVTGTNTSTSCENTASVDVTVHALPIVTAAVDFSEICLGDDVIFTGGGADTYTWDLGVTDGVPFSPVATGLVTYTVTGTNTSTTCENTATVDVEVFDNPVVTATATPDEICIGESITFTGGGADLYAWDGGITDGTPFTPAAPGTFTYTVTGSIGASGCEDVASVDIIVHDLPIVTATVDDTEICEGESVTFTGGGADSYTWDLGVTDGVPFTPAAPGTVTYTVTGTNASTTCENTASVDVTVNPLPIVTASVDLTEICLGESVTFTGGGSDDYTWDMGVTDGVLFTPAAEGTVTYTVTGTNAGTGCQNTASVDVTVYDNPVVTATATPDEICIGESITFTGGGAETYAWDGGITDGTPFTPAAAGAYTYTVIGSVGASGCENTATVDITVHDLPTVTASVDDDEICDGESVTFTGAGADSYTWDLGVTDGDPFTPPGPGTVTYTVTGTNATTTCENTATIDVTVNPLPAVIASVDFSEICIGESVIFTGSGADTYTWDWGVTDGIAFTPAAAGTETYTVTGTDDITGCQNTASIDVTVYDNPIVTATATPDEICIGESIIFTGGGADSYVWDGGITDGDPFTPGTAGTFTYNVIGSLGASGCENTASIDITVHDLPVVTATVSPIEICLGESAIFNGGGADSYSWDLGVSDDVAFTPAAAGTLTYTVTGTGVGGCTNTTTIDLIVHDLPVVTATASETEICLGDLVTLTGGGALTYTWDAGPIDGVPFEPATAGTFIYTVTGTSDAGCSSTATIEIEVVECEEVLADFTYDNNVCVGDCITLTDASLGTIISWNWDFGGAVDPATSTEQNPFVCFTTPGEYFIQLTIENLNGTTSTVSNAISVNNSPDLNVRLDTIIELGGTATLIGSSTSSGVYSWTPENDVYCAACPITQAQPEDSTTFHLIFIDENGCKAEGDVLVLVNFVEGIGVPTAFSPNGDGNNDVLYVKSHSIEKMNFSIYNRYGEVVFRSSDQNIGWDGTFKNREENPGVFTWVLHYNLTTGKSGVLKGNTSIIR
ncbi:MAG: T9SS type B sorting domain-containing protein [Crocinitomix sp.]|nr:T9SS type B sorting domain-containing protein [Crocinitomix sp.]